jgi:hypothetical protein
MPADTRGSGGGTFDEVARVIVNSPSRHLFHIRVGLGRHGGGFFLNGDAAGPSSAFPVGFLEISELNQSEQIGPLSVGALPN